MSKGHCKHGEFELTEGCPQCIAERQAAEAAPPVSIVKVRYIKQETGEPTGREYSYFTAEPLGLDFHVKAPTEHGHVEAVVVALDVPEAEVAAFRDRVRTIPAGSIMVKPVPELDFGPVETPPVAQVASLFDQAPPQVKYNCPSDCVFGYGPTGPWDNPSDGGCAKEEELAELDGEFNEDDTTAPTCPGYSNVAQDEGPTEGEHVEALWDEQKAVEQGKPAALVTIERQVNKPAPELFALYQEAASLLQFAKTRVIATNEDLKPATNDLAIILTCRKAMNARKTELVGPLKAKLDLVNQAFNDIMFPVLEADRLTRDQVQTYDRQARVAAAEARRIEDEKARLARDEAKFTGTGEFDVPLGTLEHVAPPPERTRTDLGTLGGRDNWKARVVDMTALSDEYKLPDMQTLNAKARSSKGTAVIPGVEFYNDRTTTIRTK